jgi:hypothetical protein
MMQHPVNKTLLGGLRSQFSTVHPHPLPNGETKEGSRGIFRQITESKYEKSCCENLFFG